jgi:glycosyltransferase involved in cell wall biosynthesis
MPKHCAVTLQEVSQNHQEASLRIAYASADFGIPVFGDKGASVHIQEMVNALVDLGHHVTIVAPNAGQVPDDFRAAVHRVRTMVQEPAERDLFLAEQSDRVFKERRNIAIGNAAEVELLRLHAEKPFDFIYERYSLWSAAGVRAARKLGIPLLLEVNAPLVLEQKKYRQLVLAQEAEQIEREVFAGADLVFAVSAEVRDYALSKGANLETTLAQANGVDLAKFNPNGLIADIALDKKVPVIGFSGSLKPWHGLEDLVEAFRHLKYRKIPCQLLIIGSGPMQSWIDGYAKGANLAHLIHFTGWMPHHRIPEFIRCIDIAVAPYPNIADFYFSPLKLFEYMACGRAVVASRIGQIAEVVEHGKNGILYEPGNPAALAACLEALLIDERSRQLLATAAVNAMAGRSWADCATRVVEEVVRLRSNKLKKVAS